VITNAASVPRNTSRVTERCLVHGQNVTLTCEVTYNCTNLMPMKMLWTSWAPSVPYFQRYSHRDLIVETLDVTNSSSVFHSSYTFTATEHATNDYECAVEFSPPTDVVVPHVARQYLSPPQSRFWSSPYAPRTVASK